LKDSALICVYYLLYGLDDCVFIAIFIISGVPNCIARDL